MWTNKMGTLNADWRIFNHYAKRNIGIRDLFSFVGMPDDRKCRHIFIDISFYLVHRIFDTRYLFGKN